MTIKGCGKATITITASATAKYSQAVKTVAITVNPKKMAAPKATSGKKKKIVVSWKKDVRATGYEIAYATDKNFSDARVVTIKKAKTTKTTLKNNLKSKKKYYIRIRAYRAVGAEKLYGDWSAKKTIKCK